MEVPPGDGRIHTDEPGVTGYPQPAAVAAQRYGEASECLTDDAGTLRTLGAPPEGPTRARHVEAPDGAHEPRAPDVHPGLHSNVHRFRGALQGRERHRGQEAPVDEQIGRAHV